MKRYALKKKEKLAIEIYMPESERIPSIDYDFHAADWAVCHSINSKARAILNAAQGLATMTSPNLEVTKMDTLKNYYRFDFSNEENLRIFWGMVKDYLN